MKPFAETASCHVAASEPHGDDEKSASDVQQRTCKSPLMFEEVNTAKCLLNGDFNRRHDCFRIYEYHIIVLLRLVDILHLQHTLFFDCENKLKHISSLDEQVRSMLNSTFAKNQQETIFQKSNVSDLRECWKEVHAIFQQPIFEVQGSTPILMGQDFEAHEIVTKEQQGAVKQNRELLDQLKSDVSQQIPASFKKYRLLLDNLSNWLDCALDLIKKQLNFMIADSSDGTSQQMTLLDDIRLSVVDAPKALIVLEQQVLCIRRFLNDMDSEQRPQLEAICYIRQQVNSETDIADRLLYCEQENHYRKTIAKWDCAVESVKKWHKLLQMKFSECPALRQMIEDFQSTLRSKTSLLNRLDDDISNSRRHEVAKDVAANRILMNLQELQKCLQMWHARMRDWRSHLTFIKNGKNVIQNCERASAEEVHVTVRQQSEDFQQGTLLHLNEPKIKIDRGAATAEIVVDLEDLQLLRYELGCLMSNVSKLVSQCQLQRDAVTQNSAESRNLFCHSNSYYLEALGRDIQSDMGIANLNSSNSNEYLPTQAFQHVQPTTVSNDSDIFHDEERASMEAYDREKRKYCECCCCCLEKHRRLIPVSATSLPVNLFPLLDKKQRQSNWRRRFWQAFLYTVPLDLSVLFIFFFLIYFQPTCEEAWSCMSDLQRLILSKTWEQPPPT